MIKRCDGCLKWKFKKNLRYADQRIYGYGLGWKLYISHYCEKCFLKRHRTNG